MLHCEIKSVYRRQGEGGGKRAPWYISYLTPLDMLIKK